MEPQGLMSPAPAEDPSQQMSEGEPGEQASPEEQRQFDSLLQVIYETLHGKSAQQTLQKIKAGASDMANTVGEIAAQMLSMIEEKVTAAQGQIADSVKLQVLAEIVEELLDIADAAGLVDGDPESLAQESITAAVGMYGTYKGASGSVDKNKITEDLQKMSSSDGAEADVAAAAMQSIQGMSGGAQPTGGA